MSNNGFVSSTGLDTNSSYSIFKTKDTVVDDTPKDIAERVRDIFVQQYKLIPDKDGLWLKGKAEGIPEQDFAEAYLVGQTERYEPPIKAHVVITVQVVRLDASRFGITTTYISVEP